MSDVPGELERVKAAFEGVRLNFSNEAELQLGVARVLQAEGIAFEAEKRVGKAGRLDFWLPHSGTVIETKMKVSDMALLRQLKRYSGLPEVKTLLVIDRRLRRLPATLSGKPLVQLDLWKTLIA